MNNLNPQQFAKYSAMMVPDPDHEYEYTPMPASMERHAPGEYQPTLPGMETMLKGEQTHTSVFFKNPRPNTDEWGDVPGSQWTYSDRKRNVKSLPQTHDPVVERVHPDTLRPTQDWVDDNYLHAPDKSRNKVRSGGRRSGSAALGHALVERVGSQDIIHDGHHRAVRAIMEGRPVPTLRWQK